VLIYKILCILYIRYTVILDKCAIILEESNRITVTLV